MLQRNTIQIGNRKMAPINFNYFPFAQFLWSFRFFWGGPTRPWEVVYRNNQIGCFSGFRGIFKQIKFY